MKKKEKAKAQAAQEAANKKAEEVKEKEIAVAMEKTKAEQVQKAVDELNGMIKAEVNLLSKISFPFK